MNIRDVWETVVRTNVWKEERGRSWRAGPVKEAGCAAAREGWPAGFAFDVAGLL